MDAIEYFSDFMLTPKVVEALNNSGFIKPTKVQLKGIPLCLKEKDVVIQAKTGSGKTLAFLIPLLDLLSKGKSSQKLGIQAIILVPTAELASQIICVLNKMVKYLPNINYMSVVGGKSYSSKKEEWRKINYANILISTVGRMLEHLDKNSSLDLTNLKYLIIDETDYLVEKSFLIDIENLLQYIPKERVTWLFSATQLLALTEINRLLTKNPVIIGIDDNEIRTPKNLHQGFVKVELYQKLQALWNLLIAQQKSNIIVFFNTQKEVLFVYRLFSLFKPPFRLFQLRSNMPLDKRVGSFQLFFKCDKSSVLLATDVASRGLDFPNVSLVIQYDIPRGIDYYVHRAGRTARFNARGTSVLFLLPSEVEFINVLQQNGITLKSIPNNISNPGNFSVSEQASLKYSNDPQLFTIARAAFLAYLKDFLKRPADLSTTTMSKSDMLAFAKSFGFHQIPDEETVIGLMPSLSVVDVAVEDGNDFQMPFFVVKKRAAIKRKLDITNDDDSDTDVGQESNDEVVSPAFDIEAEILRFQESSSQDKKYYNEYLKPKLQRLVR